MAEPWRERPTPPPLNDANPHLLTSEKVRASRRSYLEALAELRAAVRDSHTREETSTRARRRRTAAATRDMPAFRGRVDAS